MAIPVLECRALSKNYGSFTALSNFNLSLPAGRIIGLLGPNGSGKTTLIKMAAGLLTPTYGEILIDGRPVGIDTKKIVSYLPERTYFNESMTVRETIDFFEDFYEDFSRAKAEDMLARLHVDTGRRLKTLSKGNKEKVQLVLVMSRHARLYLLDEPIGGVDPATRDYNWIRSSRITIRIPRFLYLHILSRISKRFSTNSCSSIWEILLCTAVPMKSVRSAERASTSFSGRYSDVRKAF